MKLLILLLLASFATAAAQNVQRRLTPGFDRDEYLECLKMASNFSNTKLDSIYLIDGPQHFAKVYSSPNIGFDNGWELWIAPDSVVALSVRGSIPTELSWFSNFNAGMVSASGVAHVGTDTAYDLCPDSAAAVHAGWLGGMLYIASDMLPRIDSCYSCGYRNYIITGHSQGGAISFLLTSHLYRLRTSGRLPSDIVFKTYCSAAPKPGNMVYSCHFDYMTRGGWAFNVISSVDWVPETPLSVQTISDFAPTNPFVHFDELVGQMPLTDRMKLRFLYARLDNPTRKSEKQLRKYLGRTLGQMVADKCPGYRLPDYAVCANFQRAGVPVVMVPDADYYALYPKVYDKDCFIHHMFKSYLKLAESYDPAR